jgi:hypothetical protein
VKNFQSPTRGNADFVLGFSASCFGVQTFDMRMVWQAWLAWIILAAMAMTDGCPQDCNDPQKLIYGFPAPPYLCFSILRGVVPEHLGDFSVTILSKIALQRGW